MMPIFSRSWLMKMQVVSDFESEPADEGRDRVDDDHVDGAASNEHIGDL
jgi:hypothetical protein